MSGWMDRAVCWHLELVSGPSSEPLDVADVRDNHLRSPNGTAEDVYIADLIATSRRMAERITRRALIAQDWKQVGSGFPCGPISVALPPLIEVSSLSYVDTDGVTQTLTVTTDYVVSKPVGPNAVRAEIAPAYGTVWPVARCQLDAVTVSFTAGYLTGASPETGEIPADILHGMRLVIGELYKQRSESVHAPNQSSAMIRARDLWLPYRVY